jgi:hypothetical protein
MECSVVGSWQEPLVALLALPFPPISLLYSALALAASRICKSRLVRSRVHGTRLHANRYVQKAMANLALMISDDD